MGTPCRAEHVGSLLRPAQVLEARSARDQGRLSGEQLREVEDAAILDALELQRETGMSVFTDGELRRGSWLALFWEALEGIVKLEEPPFRIEWHDVPEGLSQDDLQLESIVVGETLRWKLSLTDSEASFLLANAPGQCKITMPSASMISNLYRPGVTDRVYPTPAAMLDDALRLQIAEIDSLLDHGVDWIQLDSLQYNAVLDEQMRRLLPSGIDPAEILARAVAIDNALIAAAKKRDGVTVGLHMCRGNNRSAWAASGSYAPVAERLFGEVDADRFLLEYDTDRAGSFEPLRFVPPGKTVVLGLVSSKTPELESKDDLRRRIEEAAEYVPIESLALSPQCGFASTVRGNILTVDDERRKLELVAETAAMIWG